MLSIPEPTDDDKATTEMMLAAFKKGPEHEMYRGMLGAALAGEVHFRGQGESIKSVEN
jgi:hypothetical protein